MVIQTFKIAADGTVDWYTYSGYRRYNAECLVCHGPNGEGSTFAPSLIDSLKTMNYSEFVDVVVNGRKNVDAANEKVMPFGTNPNVMCFLDDIFVYLRARKPDRGRPSKHEDKPNSAKKSENVCVGL
jgi:methanol metabolism-related c-type cytochrome